MRQLLCSIGRSQSRVLRAWYPRHNLAISLEWKLADLWIGAYVYTHQPAGLLHEQIDVYLIGIPTLVLHIAWRPA
jgi:hypothetical protein